MRHLVAILIAGLLVINQVQAEEYNLHIADIDTCHNFGADPASLGNTQIKVNYLDLTYDDVNQILTIDTKSDSSRGKIAELFHIVLTDGPMPGGEGAAAHIYFDATDVNDPKVNVFSYNGHGNNLCNNGELISMTDPATGMTKFAQSYPTWQQGSTSASLGAYYKTPDPILTSADAGGAAKILEATANSVTNAGVTTNSFRLVLDVSEVNLFVPRILDLPHSYTYSGVKFDDLVGVWFWAAENPTSAYNANGYLNNLTTSICAVCDQVDFESKKKPLCGDSSVTANPVEVGKTTTMSFEVINPDINDTTAAPILVSYNGLPTGAKPSVPEGEEVVFDANGEATISISWTPEAGQEGTYNIGATFYADYGLDQLVTDCAAVEVVVDPITPECKQADLDPISQADQGMSQLLAISERISNRFRKVQKQIGGSGVIDTANPSQEFTAGWQAYHVVVGEGVYLYECINAEACAGGLQITSLANDLVNFQTSLDNLNNIATARAEKLRKALIKKFIKIDGLSRDAARRKATRQIKQTFLEGQNNDGINPTYSAADSLVQLHVDTYGVDRYTCSNGAIS